MRSRQEASSPLQCGTGPIFMLLVALIKLPANRSLLSAPISMNFLLSVLSIVVEFEFGLVVLIIGNDKLHEILVAESGDNVLGDCLDLIVARISCAFCESCMPRLGEALLSCEMGLFGVEYSIATVCVGLGDSAAYLWPRGKRPKMRCDVVLGEEEAGDENAPAEEAIAFVGAGEFDLISSVLLGLFLLPGENEPSFFLHRPANSAKIGFIFCD